MGRWIARNAGRLGFYPFDQRKHFLVGHELKFSDAIRWPLVALLRSFEGTKSPHINGAALAFL
jgi:hypothetical protein